MTLERSESVGLGNYGVCPWGQSHEGFMGSESRVEDLSIDHREVLFAVARSSDSVRRQRGIQY